MPKVPTTDGPRAQLTGSPTTQFAAPQMGAPDFQMRPSLLATPQLSEQHIDTPQFKPALADPNAIPQVRLGDNGAGQMQQAGRELGGASDLIARQVLDYQRQFNATVVDDALDQARQAALRLKYGSPDQNGQLVGGYANLKGEAAFRIKDGDGQDTSLDKMVGDGFDRQVKDIVSSKLTNQDQQRAFQMQVGNIKDQLVQGALSHQAEQADAYKNSVYTNGIKSDAEAFGLLPATDAQGQMQALDQLDQKVYTLARLNGAPANEVVQKLTLARSAAISTMVETAISNKNYAQASAVLNTYAGKKDDVGALYLDPNTAAKYRLALSGEVAKQTGEQLGQAWFQNHAAPAYSTGSADRGFNITLQLENATGSQTGPDGKVLASPNGTSFGAAQLSPTTAAAVAKAHGQAQLADLAMQPTAAGKAANLQIAKWHWGDLVGQFGGDTVKAAAAYNAGAGYLVGGKAPDGTPLEGALKWAARTGQDWRDYPAFKQETKDRIAKYQTALVAGQGTPPAPSKEDGYAFINAQTTDPDARQHGYAYIDKMTAAAEQDKRQGFETAKADVIRTIDAAHGDLGAVTPEQWAKVDPTDRDSLRSYAKGMVEGKDRPTDPAALYQLQDDKFLKGLTREQLWGYRTMLGPDHFNTMADRWSRLQEAKPAEDPGNVERPVVHDLVESRLRFYGIDPTSKKPDDVARIATIRQLADDYVLSQQLSAKKKFNYKETNDAVNFLFSAQDHFRSAVFGHSYGDVQSQRILGERMADIPEEGLAAVQKQLNAAGIKNPSEQQVLDAYWRSRFFGGPKRGR